MGVGRAVQRWGRARVLAWPLLTAKGLALERAGRVARRREPMLQLTNELGVAVLLRLLPLLLEEGVLVARRAAAACVSRGRAACGEAEG